MTKFSLFKLPLFKPKCVLCDGPVANKISLCDGCRADLPLVEFACRVCALPMTADSNSSVCGQCLGQKPYVDYAINLFHYETPVDYLIGQMKFQQQLSVAAVLADLLKSHIENINLEHGLPDACLPVPLHKKRLGKRGFNQSLEIIKPLAKSQHIPILLNAVSRIKETQSQTGLSKQARKKNVSGSFTLSPKPLASHILIIDDVVTTGATTNELAKLLKKSGVKKVGVLSLARAELK